MRKGGGVSGGASYLVDALEVEFLYSVVVVLFGDVEHLVGKEENVANDNDVDLETLRVFNFIVEDGIVFEVLADVVGRQVYGLRGCDEHGNRRDRVHEYLRVHHDLYRVVFVGRTKDRVEHSRREPKHERNRVDCLEVASVVRGEGERPQEEEEHERQRLVAERGGILMRVRKKDGKSSVVEEDEHSLLDSP